MTKLAFDLEIVKEIPEGIKDIKSIRPLGISCAATMAEGDEHSILWFHGQEEGKPLEGGMTKEELAELVEYLSNYEVITWNGLQFDFDILAEESGMYDKCKEIAMNHIDMMFHIFCLKGFPLGLNTVAHGLGLPGKTEGMHGDLAPKMWANSPEDRELVLEYVAQDAKTTLDVFLASQNSKSIRWISKNGKMQWRTLGTSGWLPIQECLKIPLPDTSWMSNPMIRESFMDWIK